MSGYTIDKKIQSAFKKVGKILGFPFKQYRADNLMHPFEDRNYIADHTMAFSQDEGYSKNPADTLAYYTLYLKYGDVKSNDIFHSEELNETYSVLENVTLRGPVGVKCTHQIDIRRPVVTPLLDKKFSLEDIALSYPCAVEFVSGGDERGAMSTIPGRAGTGTMNASIWIGIPVGTVKLNDVLTISGNTYRVKSVSDQKVLAESVKAGV
jgi:hypothetical protein